MARKRYKPSVKAICKLGTISHNTQFTTRDLREYTGEGPQMIRWLKRNKLVSAEGRGKFFPTIKGWNMIDKACKR